MLAFAIGCAILIAVKWPFSPMGIKAELESGTTVVQFHGFRSSYFPPGCVLEGVEVRRAGASGGSPLLTVGRLRIRANYRGLLFKRIEFMRLENVHVNMGQKTEGSALGSKAGVTIAEIVVDDAVVEFPRKREPLQFKVHRLQIGNFVGSKPTSFHVTLDTPLPPGRLSVDGQFGPWNQSDIAATPISGSYRFTDAQLSSLGGIAGTLSSQGSFAGPARALRVQGSTDTPNYEVKSVGHPVHLQADFQAMVNCTNGDVDLQSVTGRFEKTTFTVGGDVAGKTKPSSKVASLQVHDPGGRVEDWLRLLAPDAVPAMTGPISFAARLNVPGGRKPFIRRVRLSGDFQLTEVGFTRQESQHGASELSLRARGTKIADSKASLPRVLGTLSGHVDLVDGVANFPTLTFALPGAVANVHGTYSLNDERIDLHGELRVDNKFSRTASGPRGLLTRATEGLFAKSKGDGEILPVKMTGTYDNPAYGLDK